jgi:hypothetical protein
MKQEMNNWRGFIERNKLLENREYVKYVLGIDVPLNESIPITPELSRRIIQEQLLFEGFFSTVMQKVSQGAAAVGSMVASAVDNVKSWVKEFGNNVGKLFHSLYMIMKDPSQIQRYIDILRTQMRKRKLVVIEQFTQKAMEIFQGTVFERTAKGLKDMTDSVLERYDGMKDSWKKALIGSTLSVFLDYFLSKFKDVINAVRNAKGTISSSVLSSIGEMLQGEFLSSFKSSFGDVFSQASQYMVGIAEWAEWIGKIVGGIDYVAKSLYGTTNKFATNIQSGTGDLSPAQ